MQIYRRLLYGLIVLMLSYEVLRLSALYSGSHHLKILTGNRRVASIHGQQLKIAGDHLEIQNPRMTDAIESHPRFQHMRTVPLLSTRDENPYVPEERLLSEVQAIWNLDDSLTWRMDCPGQSSLGTRYDILQQMAHDQPEGRVKYLFALDLIQVRGLLPRLMGIVVQVIKMLGPTKCALSIVEGRSTDGTFTVLTAIVRMVKDLGTKVYLRQSDIDPRGDGVDRVEMLAMLRNLALEPLTNEHDVYSENTIIVFINDIAVCPDDVYELLFQHIHQGAHQACARDFFAGGNIFYDSWVSRSMSGDLFFEIPQDATWSFHEHLFWDHAPSRDKYARRQPFQVYSCWGGMVTLDSTPFLDRTIEMRRSIPGECYAGEPTLLARDLWKIHKAHIMTLPAVSVAYSDADGFKTKKRRGWVHEIVDVNARENGTTEMIDWTEDPPGQIKCLPSFGQPSWTDPFEGWRGGTPKEETYGGV